VVGAHTPRRGAASALRAQRRRLDRGEQLDEPKMCDVGTRSADSDRCCPEILRTPRGLGGCQDPKPAGQSPGADGLAHRPGSVRRTASRRHGWRPSISGCRCRQPPATYPRARADRPRTLAVWSCSRWGLPSHGGLPPRWWSLAPPFHPYPRPEGRWRSDFCGTDPAGHPGWALPTTLSCGARTFLDTVRCRDRPASPSA
jgi:hypothetical protein